jgi:hypothetical protein
MATQDSIKARYTGSALKASAAYSQAIARNTSWFAQATSDASETHWQQGVTQAAAEKRRSLGLKTKASQSKWQTAAASKGATNIQAGITSSGDKQAAGWAPCYTALSALEIADKTPGDPLGNLQRNAGRVVATLVNVKRAREGVAPITVP